MIEVGRVGSDVKERVELHRFAQCIESGLLDRLIPWDRLEALHYISVMVELIRREYTGIYNINGFNVIIR